MTKYRAVKTKVGNIVFDSKLEAKRYTELVMMERSGRISNLSLQPRFELQPSFKKMVKLIVKLNMLLILNILIIS